MVNPIRRLMGNPLGFSFDEELPTDNSREFDKRILKIRYPIHIHMHIDIYICVNV